MDRPGGQGGHDLRRPLWVWAVPFAAVAAAARGKTIVLHIQHPAWVQVAGFLVQAERAGVRACVDSTWYTFLFTSQFICTPAQAAAGAGFRFYDPAPPAGARVLLRLGGISIVPIS